MAEGSPTPGGSSARHGSSSSAPSAFPADPLAAHADLFKSLADNSLEFIGLCDLHFIPFYVNEAGCRLVGLGTMEEACAVKVQDFFFPEDQRFITEEFFPKVLRHGRAEVEIRFRHFQTGAALWMIYNVFQLRDAHGAVAGYATVSRDITSRKTAEKELRQAREEYRLLVENQTDMVARMSRDGRRLYVNANFLKLVGKTEAQVLSTDYTPDIHPDDVARVADEWQKTFQPPLYRSEIEARTRTADGSWRWCSWRNVAVLDENGEHSTAISVGRDITEHKQVMQALHDFAETLTLAQQASGSAVWDWGLDPPRVVVSPEYRRMFSFSGDEPVTAEKWLQRIHPADRDATAAHLQQFFAGRQTEYRHSYRILHPQRGERWIAALARLQRAPEGRPLRFVGISLDITEQKRAETRLELAQEAARAGFFDWDILNARFYVTGMLRGIEGVDPVTGELSLHAWQQVVHPDDYARVTAEFAAAFAARQPQISNEFRLRLRGEELWLHGHARIEYDPAGNAIHATGIDYDVTERRRAAHQLDQVRAMLAEGERIAHMGTWRWDAATGDTLWSDEEFRIYGLQPGARPPTYAELLQHHFHPEDAAELDRVFRRAVETRSVFENEHRIVQPLGEVRCIHNRAHPQFDAAGALVGYVGATLDITERERVQERLRIEQERVEQSRKLLAQVVERCPYGIYIVDSDFRIAHMNARSQAGAFRNVRSVIGTSFEEAVRIIWPPAVAAEVIRLFRHALETGEPYCSRDFIQQRQDVGVQEAYEWELHRITLPDGRHGVVCYFFDSTDLRQAQQALRESEERLRLALEGGRMGLWEWHVAAGRVVWNAREFELLGLPPQDGPVSAELFFQRILPEDLNRLQSSLRKAREAGQEWYDEFRVARPDGAIRWLAGAGRVLHSPSGEPERMIGVNYDITEKRAFEAELQRLVDERTARLQELVGELEHFSYTITHDLKAPLRAMRGFAEMAGMAWDEQGGRQSARDFLARIATAADRMDRLIADALSYSRAVRQELPLEPVDLGALLRGMLDTYPELQAHRARIHLQEPLPLVLANQAGLTQAFSNLLGNAVKFLRPGQLPEVTLWAAPAGPCVRIWVQDNGIGISSHMLPRVFDMFSRGSNAYEGTGIGLALVRKVVQRMGGKVGVESHEGQGSRFWIDLQPAPAPLQPAPPSVPATPQPRPGAVLYVEDEETDAIFMQRAFHRKAPAHTLRRVADGRQAIDYLSGSGPYADRAQYPVPALVLLDLNLPHVTGFEVLQWMRQHPAYRRTPVVIFSSSTRQDDRARAAQLGANDFIAKPSSGLQFTDLLDRLHQWLTPAAAP